MEHKTFFKDNEPFSLDVLPVGKITQFTGLMFKTTKTPIRFFSYPKDGLISIHSWFVFFPFLAVWLDKKYTIVEWKMVKPFSNVVRNAKPAKYLLEIPCSQKEIISFIVDKKE